jgi:hypothetical protein
LWRFNFLFEGEKNMLLTIAAFVVVMVLAFVFKFVPFGMTLITPTTVVKDTTTPTSIPIASGTAFTDASSHTLAMPLEGKVILMINSTYAGANTVTIAAGDGIAAGKGALSIVTAQNGVYYVDLSSDRFKTYHTSTGGSGVITITFGTSNTGFVHALLLPT